MDMNVIREYIIADSEINQMVGDNVFLFEKPEKKTCTDYIIYTFKEINGGNAIRNYQLDLRCISKDKLKLFEVKDRLIEILDNFNKPTNIKNEELTIRNSKLINGGGIIKDEENGDYHLIVYFLVKI